MEQIQSHLRLYFQASCQCLASVWCKCMYSKQQCPVLTTQGNQNWADCSNHKLDQACSIPLYHLHIHPAHHLAVTTLYYSGQIYIQQTHADIKQIPFWSSLICLKKEKSMTWTVPQSLYSVDIY